MNHIGDYALLGDSQTAALVGRDGSIDWLCVPAFDSPACFAALLGDERNGRWLLAPADPSGPPRRRYLDDTLVLETTWHTATGSAQVLDFMPPRGEAPDVVRIVRGVSGRVELRSELHAQGPHLRAHRRDRGRGHDQPAGTGRRPAQLGLPPQFYGSHGLDASLLLIPQVGFLPPDDPRVTGTVEAVGRELLRDGFLLRYDPEADGGVDALPGGEGAFLACTFWYADALALVGRRDEACAVFERLLGLRNDVGLLSEEYDVQARQLIGNIPQAYSHVFLVHTARILDGSGS